ncbi:MAG: outer membrane protein assembly factor BamA [Bdellovibrionota bacterium]
MISLAALSFIFPSTSLAQTKPSARAKKKPVVAAKAKRAEKLDDSALAGPAAFSFSIDGLRVKGNKKIETDAILAKVVSKPGVPVTPETVREDIEALFKTNYFYDVVASREQDGGKTYLQFTVVEKPTVMEVVYEGIKELKEEEVKEASGIKQYELLNLARLKEAADKMTKFYEDKGFYLARVEPVVQDITKDEAVRVIFKIQENDRVKVKKISFIGNKNLSEGELKGRLSMQEEGYFSAISSSGAYKQESLERDTLILRFMYYNQGYIQAKIDRPQVTITPDKKSIYISYVVDEGLQYEVGEIDYEGDLLFPKEELLEATNLRNSRLFVYEILQKDLSDLQAKYGDLGYAYANVIPRYKFRDAEKKVDLIFEFDKGNKVYFGQINVTGNSKTRDKVVRRELRVIEGELYNETRRRKSLENIQRLGFFDEVNFKTSTPQGQPDIMNVDVVVKERNTGQIQLGAGYGTSSGFSLQGSVQQTNFLGKGQNLGVTINFASNYSQYDFTFTEPYFNDTLWSAGFRVFQSSNSGRADYDEKRTGGSIFFGHPIGEDLRANISYTYTATQLSEIRDDKGKLITDYDIFPLQTASGDAGLLGGSLEYDTRNDRFKPTKGIYARTSYSQTGYLGGNLHYSKYGADFRYFKNVFWDVIFRNSLSYNRIQSTRTDLDVPFNELNLLGGPYSLRGYRYARVGKRKYSSLRYADLISKGYPVAEAKALAQRYYGGEQQVLYQGEFLFPLIREAEMYGVAFYDVGQAEDNITGESFFADTGMGIRWFSPIGPLRFEWGFPLNRDSVYHEPVVFEFSIGTPF